MNGTLAAMAGATAEHPRPRLRGVVHAVVFPLALAAGIVLVALAPTGSARTAAAVYAACAALMFGASALFHLRAWTGRAHRMLERLDHSGIYLAIAGTYTPFAVLGLEGTARVVVLTVVWAGAAAGLVTLGTGAPRALRVALYLLLGWVAALVLPQLLDGAGVAAAVLAIVGGALYSLGALVYALRRPDPLPAVFGFHETFHVLIAAAFVTQHVGVALLVYPAG